MLLAVGGQLDLVAGCVLGGVGGLQVRQRPGPGAALRPLRRPLRQLSAILAQTDVDPTTNEIARFRPLLDRLDLTGTVVTADALHTQRGHADWLVTHQHAAYLLMVKANQPTLHQQLRRLPWREVPVADHPATAATAASSSAACRSPPCPAYGSPTPPGPCGSPDESGR